MFTETGGTRRCPDRNLRTLVALREGSSKLHCSCLDVGDLFWKAMGPKMVSLVLCLCMMKIPREGL